MLIHPRSARRDDSKQTQWQGGGGGLAPWQRGRENPDVRLADFPEGFVSWAARPQGLNWESGMVTPEQELLCPAGLPSLRPLSAIRIIAGSFGLPPPSYHFMLLKGRAQDAQEDCLMRCSCSVRAC